MPGWYTYSLSLFLSPRLLSLRRILHDQSVSFCRTHSHERRPRVHRGRMRKGSRMDRATWSRCNCMLIECASEYGIRMEAIQFDIPFCLRPSPLRSRHPPLPLVISSSPLHLLRRRRPSSSSSSSISFFRLDSFSRRRCNERGFRRHCMRFENDSLPSPLSSLLLLRLFHARSLSSFLCARTLPCLVPSLAFLYIGAHNVHSCNPLRGISCALYTRDISYMRVYACVRKHAAELMRHTARRGTLG